MLISQPPKKEILLIFESGMFYIENKNLLQIFEWRLFLCPKMFKLQLPGRKPAQ